MCGKVNIIQKESHGLELSCDVPMSKCPRAMGAFSIELRYVRAKEKYRSKRTLQNKKGYQEALDAWARYCGVEPQSYPALCVE